MPDSPLFSRLPSPPTDAPALQNLGSWALHLQPSPLQDPAVTVGTHLSLPVSPTAPARPPARQGKVLPPLLHNASVYFSFLCERNYNNFFSYTLAVPHFTLSSLRLHCLQGPSHALRTQVLGDPRAPSCPPLWPQIQPPKPPSKFPED